MLYLKSDSKAISLSRKFYSKPSKTTGLKNPDAAELVQ